MIDPKEFGNLTLIRISGDQIWTYEIKLPNNLIFLSFIISFIFLGQTLLFIRLQIKVDSYCHKLEHILLSVMKVHYKYIFKMIFNFLISSSSSYVKIINSSRLNAY